MDMNTHTHTNTPTHTHDNTPVNTPNNTPTNTPDNTSDNTHANVPKYIINTFKIILIITLLLSLYFFIDVVILKNTNYRSIFSTWQFPVLLAVYLDTLYIFQA